MDFIKDLKDFAIQQLTYHNINFNENVTAHKLLMRLNLFYLQWIQPIKRHTFISKELQSKIVNKEIPEEKIISFNKLKTWIINGIDINGYQSKKYKNETNKDYQHSLYGIRHLHLSPKAEDKVPNLNKSGHAKTSGYLLLAYFKEANAYFIDIRTHPKKNMKNQREWTTREILIIFENNWPSLIENYRIPGAVKLSQEVDDEALYNLTSHGASTFIDTGNGIYMPNGMGVASSGDNVLSVIQADNMMNNAHKAEEWFYKNEKCIKQNIQKSSLIKNGYIPDLFDFHYIYNKSRNEFIITDLISGCIAYPINF